MLDLLLLALDHLSGPLLLFIFFTAYLEHLLVPFFYSFYFEHLSGPLLLFLFIMDKLIFFFFTLFDYKLEWWWTGDMGGWICKVICIDMGFYHPLKIHIVLIWVLQSVAVGVGASVRFFDSISLHPLLLHLKKNAVTQKTLNPYLDSCLLKILIFTKSDKIYITSLVLNLSLSIVHGLGFPISAIKILLQNTSLLQSVHLWSVPFTL